MRIVLILTGKDLLLRWRDRLGFFWWMVGFPLLIAILIGQIFAGVLEGPSQPMSVAVVDEAHSPASQAFVAAMQRSEGVAVQVLPRAEAQAAVRRGKLMAFVLLSESFRLTPAVLWGHEMPFAIGIDPIRKAEAAYLQATLHAAAIDYLRTQWFDLQRRPALIRAWLDDLDPQGQMSLLGRAAFERALVTLDQYLRPAPSSRPVESGSSAISHLANIPFIPVDESQMRPRSAFEICFPLGILWGLLGLAAEFAIAIVQERETGTLLRLRAAPITRGHLLAGNGLACFASCLGVILLLLVVGRLIFGIRLQNPAALAVAVACIAACFVGLTLLLSVLGRTESAVGGAAWACLIVMAMLGGGMVPQIFLPSWMETAGNVSPVKWAILSLEGGIWRGFSLREMVTPCGILLGQGIAFAAAGTLMWRRIDR